MTRNKAVDLFAQYRAILAGAQFSLMHLGIGPIVTGSIIMQLFIGAKIIKLNLKDDEDKAVYQGTQKFLVIIMILVEAVPQVFGFMEPSAKFATMSEGILPGNGEGLGTFTHSPPAVRRLVPRVPHGRGRLQVGHRERHIALHRGGRGAADIHRLAQLASRRRTLSLTRPASRHHPEDHLHLPPPVGVGAVRRRIRDDIPANSPIRWSRS